MSMFGDDVHVRVHILIRVKFRVRVRVHGYVHAVVQILRLCPGRVHFRVCGLVVSMFSMYMFMNIANLYTRKHA
jgi:hypothetical protein